MNKSISIDFHIKRACKIIFKEEKIYIFIIQLLKNRLDHRYLVYLGGKSCVC